MEPEGAATGPRADAKMPRWVKAFVLVAVLLAFGFVILHLSGVSPRH